MEEVEAFVCGETGESPEREFDDGGTVRELRKRLSGNAPREEEVGGYSVEKEGREVESVE